MGFAKAQVNFIQFNRAMVDLQRVTGQTMKQVVRSETAEILSTCVKKTKVAKKNVVQRKEQLGVIKKEKLTQAESPGRSTVNSGWKLKAPYGRIWLRVRQGNTKAFILARGADFSAPSGRAILRPGTGKWNDFVNQAASTVTGKVPTAIARGFASIGLGRQSWIQMAESIRLNIRGLLDGEDAMASRAQYQNGVATEQQSGNKYIITLINKLPYVRRAKLDAILARAINQRTALFNRAIRSSVFNSAKKTLAKYPGLEVR